MGDPACYLDLCPRCDAPTDVTHDRCPACGTRLDGSATVE